MKKIRIKKSKSEKSKKWLERHFNDYYFNKSKQEGFRSRSSYKLIEIEKKFRVFSNCKNVLDLGCAPGGWLQVARIFSPNNAIIMGIDRLKIEKIDGVEFIEKDIFDNQLEKILQDYFKDKIDVLLSDMSPNSSGNKSIDHLRIISLVERVLELSKVILKPKGFLISKIFQGGAQGELIKQMQSDLNSIKYFKPKASRKESSETYLVAKKN
ncbi:MAG: RlmE family RNA methyltransferase [Alphaproteobacteria bacterium]|tara:strand:- start:1389 stop:2021 length:633 start_codon:yes stop_codon:yes gene_type:complete